MSVINVAEAVSILNECEPGLDSSIVNAALQELIDTGMAWRLEGSIGRQCMAAIDAGRCTVGTERHTDFYGNVVPAIRDLEPGAKGTPEFVAAHSDES